MLKNRFRGIRGLFVVALTLTLSACSWQSTWDSVVDTFGLRSFVTFFTAGQVAEHERNLMVFTLVVLMFVLIPVVVLTLWFAWRYRESNTKATHSPEWSHSSLLEVFLWGGPAVIIVVLGVMTWVSTHELDPYKPIESEHDAIQVEAISMDWKWLFIYPEQGVAVVNEMAMPVDVPVSMRLTSATVMNALMIPRLGSQMFAMSGMQTKLNFIANKPGTYFGKNYQYSGEGFDNMHFDAIATNREGFEQWVAKAKKADRTLDRAALEELEQPTHHEPVQYYSDIEPGLFEHVIKQFNNHYTPQTTAEQPAWAAK